MTGLFMAGAPREFPADLGRYERRVARLRKLIDLNAPALVVVGSAVLIAEAAYGGPWRLCWRIIVGRAAGRLYDLRLDVVVFLGWALGYIRRGEVGLHGRGCDGGCGDAGGDCIGEALPGWLRRWWPE